MHVVLNFNFEAPRQLTAEVSAVVNCRSFLQWLTAAGSIIRLLTIKGHLSNLHVFFSLSKCVDNNFLNLVHSQISLCFFFNMFSIKSLSIYFCPIFFFNMFSIKSLSLQFCHITQHLIEKLLTKSKTILKYCQKFLNQIHVSIFLSHDERFY